MRKTQHEKMEAKGAKCIAILGTGSDVGKSVVVTAICRILASMGIRVAPYKAQNMSNNSGVTPDGLEMGRAQIVQAEAAGIPPHVDMNPVLLKPTADASSQVILSGRVIADTSAARYQDLKSRLFAEAAAALDRLRQKYEVIVMEGAGSCAEINLLSRDIVNLPMARYANAPVVLVGDIHRGGIFAQLAGTLKCLPDHYSSMISGFIINRFRGDISLFGDGKKWIEEYTGRPVYGVVPWFDKFRIPAEDSVVIEQPDRSARGQGSGSDKPWICIVRLPHIANFTDFDPLFHIPGLDIRFAEDPLDISGASVIIIPGTKSTLSDLAWLHSTGWAQRIREYAESGRPVLGICGGYQMLGRRVLDPDGVEGRRGSREGLCLLPAVTTLVAPKVTTLTRFSWNGIPGIGYEIHMGRTETGNGRPVFAVSSRNNIACNDVDGLEAEDLRVIGTYIHGLFDSPGILDRFLQWAGLNALVSPRFLGMLDRDRSYDMLADHFKQHVDMDALLGLLDR